MYMTCDICFEIMLSPYMYVLKPFGPNLGVLKRSPLAFHNVGIPFAPTAYKRGSERPRKSTEQVELAYGMTVSFPRRLALSEYLLLYQSIHVLHADSKLLSRLFKTMLSPS